MYFPVMLGANKYGAAVCTVAKQVSDGKLAALSLYLSDTEL